jgi:hypothetical protein
MVVVSDSACITRAGHWPMAPAPAISLSKTVEGALGDCCSNSGDARRLLAFRGVNLWLLVGRQWLSSRSAWPATFESLLGAAPA